MVHAGKGGGRMFVNAARINGRKSNFSLLEYIQSEVRAGESPVPPWMPATLISPPPTIPNVPHPGPLTYPEDKLRQVWFDRHPEARKIKLKTVYVGEHRYWQHPATSFVHRQSKLIKKGYSEQDAYDVVEAEDKKAARYRELERLMAIEQAKELGFDDLETARDLLAPPDLTQARERMLEELIDVLKAKGVPNVVPELLPKGMKWRDVLAFVHKYPQHAHFFSLGFMATHAIETMNPEIADAYNWIYGGEVLLDDDSVPLEEQEELNAFLDEEGFETVDDDYARDQQDLREQEQMTSEAVAQYEPVVAGVSLVEEGLFFDEDDDEEEDESEAAREAEEHNEEQRIATVKKEGEQFKAILKRIEKIYRPEQFPTTADTPWADLVNLLALRPHAPDVKLAQDAEQKLRKASQAKRPSAGSSRPQSQQPNKPIKGKEVELL
jgi:hypothetical protein